MKPPVHARNVGSDLQAVGSGLWLYRPCSTVEVAVLEVEDLTVLILLRGGLL